ncbi:Toprim-like [Granulicatella balaenopterae]|uniref:Toprim-like n=1 Tax=Granulicatella balaenopterae TaxID=137733 RepID=A0A1H9I0V4_9LACT|nr:DUF3991 domain-containing protein [Granulicatella balaenopterae]SEQ68231.1 Toprim-like [Granulicatella balaenopterae]
MAFYTREEIKEATLLPIEEYIELTGIGNFTRKKGNFWNVEINGSDSIVIDLRKNIYYHNSQAENGNIINFIQKFENATFPEAVKKALTLKREEKIVDFTADEETKEPFEYYYNDSPNFYRARNYLINERKLSPYLIDKLHEANLIREDEFGNAIFVWTENGKPNGKVVGATQQRIKDNFDKDGNKLPKKFIAKNSEFLGFNISLGTPDKFYVFEAPIDLLSYYTLHPELKNCRLIAMDGVKTRSISNFYINNKKQFDVYPTKGVYIGTDLDRAGVSFYLKGKQALETQAIDLHSIIPNFYTIQKDFVDIYDKYSKKYNVDKALIMAIHKVENGGTLSKKAFHKEGPHYFTDYTSPNVSYTMEEFEKRLSNLIEDAPVTLDGLPKQSSSEEMLIKISKSDFTIEKQLKDYYLYYKNNDYDIKNFTEKDWNDILVNKKNNSQVQEKIIETPETKELENSESEIETEAPVEQTPPKVIDTHPKFDKEEFIKNYGVTNLISNSIMNLLTEHDMLDVTDNKKIVFNFMRNKRIVGGVIQDGNQFERTDGASKFDTFSISLGKPKNMLVFNNPKQLLEYWTLNEKNINDMHLVSLAGLTKQQKLAVMKERISIFKNVDSVVLVSERSDEGRKILRDLKELRIDYPDKTMATIQPFYASTWKEELEITKKQIINKNKFNRNQKTRNSRSRKNTQSLANKNDMELSL